MVNVTAIKIRDNTQPRSACSGLGRPYSGYLISFPTVGRGMVIFRDPSGHRMVTTPVRRVLSEFGAADIYVETENSVYRLRFRSVPAVEDAARATVKSG
jgi:hypothetical protein